MNKILEIALRDIGSRGTQWKFAWCAAWLNDVLMRAGIKGTESNLARSFQKVFAYTDNPTLGDIVVMWRVAPNSWQGHVGFYISETPSHVYVLGGNQDDEVNIKPYPKWQVIGYSKINA